MVMPEATVEMVFGNNVPSGSLSTDYPEECLISYNFDVWLNNNHRHFEHEWMRYASYWLQTYWTAKHGVEAVGNVWKGISLSG